MGEIERSHRQDKSHMAFFFFNFFFFLCFFLFDLKVKDSARARIARRMAKSISLVTCLILVVFSFVESNKEEEVDQPCLKPGDFCDKPGCCQIRGCCEGPYRNVVARCKKEKCVWIHEPARVACKRPGQNCETRACCNGKRFSKKMPPLRCDETDNICKPRRGGN